MDQQARRRACLAVTVAAAWAGSASPAMAVTATGTPVYTRLTNHLTYISMRFVELNHLTWLGVTDLGSLPASNDTYRSFIVSSGTGSGGGDLLTRYAFLGVSMGSGSGGGPDVTISFADPNRAIGQPFETLFPGVSEAGLADAITTGGTNLDGYLGVLMQSTNFGAAMESPSGLVHFSEGVGAGASLASFSPIPEPGSAMVCLGALGVGCLTRRRALAV